jgi:hypothetical protein
VVEGESALRHTLVSDPGVFCGFDGGYHPAEKDCEDRSSRASLGAVGARWIEGEKDDVIVVDDSHFPVIVSTWIDAPTEQAVRGYFAWLDEMLARAVRDDTPIVNVSDAGQAELPTAEVRRLVADLTGEWERRGADSGRVTSLVVIESAVMRGVLNALAWMHGNFKTRQFSTCEEALAAALHVLERARCPAPPLLVPSQWRRPRRSPWSR